MKVRKPVNKAPDLRVWCEHCSIRIAPHEEKSVVRGKTYHQRCYSKYGTAMSKTAGASSQPANTLGDR
jgi:hypothetical protein